MRKLVKKTTPGVLQANASAWLLDYETDRANSTKKYRYRHPDIKDKLREETHWKCVYCESKIGHNTPGDIEHKIPSSKVVSLHFEWTNLTVACTECNRRKNDHFEKGNEFLDPYQDDVEQCLVHLGPLVYSVPGETRAETTVKILQMDSNRRRALFDRKCEVLDKARALLELAQTATPGVLKELRRDEVKRMCQIDAEFSAMVGSYVRQVEPTICS